MTNARASDKGRSTSYFLLGTTGLLISTWFLGVLLKADPGRVGTLGLAVFWATDIILYMASFVNFYTAYAFKYGRVDEVAGTMNSAVLIQNGKTVLEGCRIQLKRNYDWENTKLTDEERDVLFICDWRPWVCSLKKFRCVDSIAGGASGGNE